jgi:Primase C terminal 2 (PriCT-2)/Bifunctional DNA primase/polymerase, N-terminal
MNAGKDRRQSGSGTKSYMARLGARLVDNRYPVLPIMPGTKKPGLFKGGAWRDYPGWTKHGNRPTSEHELIVWSAWPDAGIGIPTGTVIGVDIDIRDDDLASRLEQLAREVLGDTPAIRFGLPPKRLLVYRAAQPLSGMKAHPIEVLGLGQQFVAFADHPNTRRPYQWPQESPAELPADALPLVDETTLRAFLDQAHSLVPPELRPGRLPGEATAWAAAVAAGDLRGTPDAIAEALHYIPNADLDYDSWIRIGMALKGALAEAGRELFEIWSATSTKDVPEFTAKTWASLKPERIGAGTIYHHALAAGWTPDPALVLNGGILVNGRHPARSMLERLTTPVAPAAPAAPPPTQRTPVDPRMFQLDGALKLFVDYIRASAVRPQPILAIGASLCALGALMGRKYRTQTNLRTNLYVVGMAGSGGGKDHARSAIKEAFIAAGLQRCLGGNRIASGAGLLTALYRQPSILFQLDEFGQFLGNVVNKRHAPKYLAEIWDLLTELSTSAGGTFFGAEYADQKQKPREDIVQPCCCVHATTVPEPFWAALQQGSIVDGSLARFLVFQTDDDVPDRNRCPKPVGNVPPELIEALRSIVVGAPEHSQGNIAALVEGPMIAPDPYPVPMAPEAEQLFDELDEGLTAQQREAIGTNQGAVLARIWENTAKVALIKAVSAEPQNPVIRLEDAEWARIVVERCVTTMLTEAERHIADNQTQANHQKVLRLIQAAGARGMTKSEVTRRTQFLDLRQRQEILIALIESGQVELSQRASDTRPASVYRAVAA